jgi:Peptidase MA superfamily
MSRLASFARPGAALALAVALGLGRPPAALAADPPEFETPEATSSYGVNVQFEQRVTLAEEPSRVEVLLRTPSSDGPTVVDYDGRVVVGPNTFEYELLVADGHIVPNTTFSAQWRVIDQDGTAWVGPSVSETYSDTDQDWETLQGDVVKVHWYEGGEAFGQRALQIGDDAVAEVSQLLGVTEEEPIDFFIYADQEPFYAALGPSTRENVGGEAHADIRTMFALITPADINADWVEIVVPHELTHLVFDTATDNPYHDPPHWLNEGVAVYLSEGYTASDRALVEDAARSGTIMPLEGLVGAFPTTRDRFFLAYAESVSAVDDIVGDHGQDALVGLIRSYADGVSDDEAFTAALGMDVAAFEQSWLEGVGAQVPVQHGPQPAPAGPLPEGWSGAAPNPTVGPGATPRPGTNGGVNAPIDQPSNAPPNWPLLVGAGLVVLAVAGAAFLFIRRRRPATASPAGSVIPATAWSPPPSARQPEPAPFTLPTPDDGPPAFTERIASPDSVSPDQSRGPEDPRADPPAPPPPPPPEP